MIQTGIQKLHQIGADRLDHMLAMLHVFQSFPFFVFGVGSFKHFDGIFDGQFSKTQGAQEITDIVGKNTQLAQVPSSSFPDHCVCGLTMCA